MDNMTRNWRKSSRSFSNGNCVEIGNSNPAGSGGGMVAARDTTQHGTGPVLRFTPAAWARFTGDVKEGCGTG